MPRIQANGSAAPSGQPTFAFPTPQAFEAADMSAANDLSLVNVGTVNDQYLFLEAPVPLPAADGLNVIAPSAPAGSRGLRQYLQNQLAQYVTTWFVDAVAGDDRNAGTTTLTALKTLVELGNRLRNASIGQDVLVTLAAGTYTDFGPLDLRVATGVLVTIQGDVTSTAGRTVGATVITNPLTNTRGTFADAGGTFARSQRIRTTVGSFIGAITWLQGGTTGTSAHVTGWSRYTSHAPPGNVLPTAGEPVSGDTYVTDTLNSVFQGRFDLRVHGAGRVLVKDVKFTTDPANSFASFQYLRPQCDVPSLASMQFVACLFDANAFPGITDATCRFDQCLFQSTFNAALQSSAGMSYCVFQAAVNVVDQGFTQWQGFMTLDGGNIVQAGGGFIELNGCFVQAGATPGTGKTCWELDPGTYTYQHNTSLLWGPTSGYAIGVRTYAASAFQYNSVPTLTGSTQDMNIAGALKVWADLPVATTAELSGVVALP